jgi:hypothetical protein
MSQRPKITPHAVITNGDMTLSLTSAISIINEISMFSYALTWSGASPVGTINVQVSNDYRTNAAGGVVNAGTWNNLQLSNPCTVTGNTGTGFIDIDQLGAYAVRVTYTPASGTGSLNCVVSGKVS